MAATKTKDVTQTRADETAAIDAVGDVLDTSGMELAAPTGAALVSMASVKGGKGRAARPSSLAGALMLAQERCKMAPADGMNTHRGRAYASAESILRTANEALRGLGLITFPLGRVPINQSEISGQGKEWFALLYKFQVEHVESGETKEYQACVPVLFERGRSVEDSFAITDTRALSSFLRQLLRMPRETKAAAVAPDNGGEAARQERVKAAEAAKAAKAAASANGAAPTAAPPAAPTAKPAEAKPQPAVSTAPGSISQTSWGQLEGLRAELFGLEKISGDDGKKRERWAGLLAQHGAKRGQDLSESAALKLIADVWNQVEALRNAPATLQESLAAESFRNGAASASNSNI